MVVTPKVSLFSKINFDHDNPEVFVTTQWTREVRKSKLFLLFRWLLAAYYIYVTAYSFYVSRSHEYIVRWFIYMTHWGIILCLISTTFAATLTTLYHFNAINLTKQSTSYKVFWFLTNVSTVWAFVITIVYWSLLYNGTTSAIDILIHGGNSVGMLLEILFVRYPMYFTHFIYPVGSGIIYAIFSVIYHFSGGTDPLGNRYIYSILKWEDESGKSTLLFFGVLILAMFLHIIFCVVQRLRNRLHKKIFSDPTSFDLKNNQQLTV